MLAKNTLLTAEVGLGDTVGQPYLAHLADLLTFLATLLLPHGHDGPAAGLAIKKAQAACLRTKKPPEGGCFFALKIFLPALWFVKGGTWYWIGQLGCL